MGVYGHIGSPQYATAELGKLLNESCIASLCEAVVCFYKRSGYQAYAKYPLYAILPLHIGFLGMAGKVRRRSPEKRRQGA